jgi:hypothetical protein
MAIDGGDIGDGMTIPDYAAIGLLIVLLMLWPRLDAKRLAAEKPRGSLAMLAAIRRASSLLSNLAAERRPGSSSK